jgi:AraC-like DNA-binding protein
MENFTDKIRLLPDQFVFQTLDSSWNTENFHLSQLGIPYARLYYPVEGWGHVLLEDRKYTISPGKIYLIAPYAPVKVSCPERLVKYWGHFNAFILGSKLDIFTFADPILELDDDSPEFRVELFKILCENYLTKSKFLQSPVSKLEEQSALALLLAPFLKEIQDALTQKRELTRFVSLLEYIETHLEQSLSLHDLGAFAGMNPTYLSNLFAEKTGMPLMKYCKQRSVQRAIDLMWTGKYSFSEIAYKSGAQNVAAFSRLFKKYTAVSPRAMQRKINDSRLSGRIK